MALTQIGKEGITGISNSANANAITIDSGENVALSGTLGVTGVLTGTSLDISGNIDIDGTSNLDVVDIDGAVDMASTLQVDGAITTSSAMSITTTGVDPQLLLISTEAGANPSPQIDLYRNSSSPADDDTLGQLNYYGENSADEKILYTRVRSAIADVTDGDEGSNYTITTYTAGSQYGRLNINETETIFNENSANIDFRVETDGNANMLFVDGGNNRIGIGTSSPDGTLHVHSNSAGSVTPQTDHDDLTVENNGHGGISILTPDANRSAIVFGHASDNLKMQLRHDGNTSLSQLISDDPLTFNVNGGTERMRINSSGNVGIGTSSPNFPLDVVSDSSANGIQLRGRSADNIGQLNFESNDSGTAYSQIQSRSTELFIKTLTNIPMSFYTNNTERMRIDGSSGNVGIGTASPAYQLTLSDNQTYWEAGFETTVSGGNQTLKIISDAHGGGGRTGDIKFYTNSTSNERVCITSAGNLGIGYSAPDRKLVVKDSGTATLGQFLQIDDNNSNATANPLHINYSTLQLINAWSGSAPSANGTKVAKLAMATATTSGYGATASITCLAGGTGYNSGVLAFNTGSNNQNLETERMRIEANGNLLIGSTSYTSSSNNKMIEQNGGVFFARAVTSSAGQLTLANPNGNVGQIRTSGSTTTYATSSDYRLKDNINYTFDATSQIKQLKPCEFNFKTDLTTKIIGFIAHETQEIVPQAVSGTKDAMTAEVLYVDGNEIPDGKKVGDVKEASKIDPQGIDNSHLVPLLVKTIQELEARITTLENK